MVGDVLFNSEASVVTSSISRFAGPTWFFGGAHRGRVCVRAFIGVECALVYVSICVNYVGNLLPVSLSIVNW